MTPWASCSAKPKLSRLWAMPQARPATSCNAVSCTATTNWTTAPTPACLTASPCTGCSMARATCTTSTSLRRKALTSLRPRTRSSPIWNATPCTAKCASARAPCPAATTQGPGEEHSTYWYQCDQIVRHWITAERGQGVWAAPRPTLELLVVASHCGTEHLKNQSRLPDFLCRHTILFAKGKCIIEAHAVGYIPLPL